MRSLINIDELGKPFNGTLGKQSLGRRKKFSSETGKIDPYGRGTERMEMTVTNKIIKGCVQ